MPMNTCRFTLQYLRLKTGVKKITQSVQICDVSVTVVLVFAYAPNKSASRVRRTKILFLLLSRRCCGVFREF